MANTTATNYAGMRAFAARAAVAGVLVAILFAATSVGASLPPVARGFAVGLAAGTALQWAIFWLALRCA